MKKTIIFSIIAIAFIAVIVMFAKKNKQKNEIFETEKAFKATIVEKTVATGKVLPLEEVEIKPQISGIIDKIFVEEGADIMMVKPATWTPPTRGRKILPLL